MREFFGENEGFRGGLEGGGGAGLRFERVFQVFRRPMSGCRGAVAGRARRSRAFRTAGFLLVFVLAPDGAAQESPTEVLRLPVRADTWVSSAPGETEGNNGGAARLKTKSYQEMTLLDLDPAPLAGRVIERATLHLRSVAGSPLGRASVSSVGAPWREGRSKSYAREPGAASFREAETGRRAWTEAGGDLSEVVLAAGNTRWSSAEATPPDERGWQRIDVEPAVLATRVAGLGHGFLVFDDVGSEYTRDGDKFAYHPFPNRFAASREAGPDSAPCWTIELGAPDTRAPDPVDRLAAVYENVAADGVRVMWDVPADPAAPGEASSGTLGFLVRYATEPDFEWEAGREVPSYRVPRAGAPGGRVTAHLAHLALPQEAHVHFEVRAVDAAGNVSAGRRVSAWFTGARALPELVRPRLSLFDGGQPPLRLGATQVALLDELDKLDLGAAELPPSIGDRAAPGRITLVGCEGERTGFQVALRGPVDGLRAALQFDDGVGRSRIYVARGVDTPRGRFADPLEPWDGASEAEFGPDAIACLYVEVELRSQGTRLGDLATQGRLTLTRGADRLELWIGVALLSGSLAGSSGFLAEMNAYDLPPPPAERAWYELAHEHRTCLNVLRYDWKGRVHAGAGPKLVDGELDWTEFDARFGPLLDGWVIGDDPYPLPAPETFYLPLNENWPVAIEPHFRGGYWVETALDAEYFAELERYTALVARHVVERGWRDTTFEIYLNNKLYHKNGDWKGSSAPWIFDEPMHTQDFFALRRFAECFRAGVRAGGDPPNVVFRADVSRPQWQRDVLDGLVGVHVVGSAFDTYPERVLERKRAGGERLMLYATANAVEASNVMPVAWCIDAWLKGADGVIPWQTIGRAASWKNGDAQALLYPPRDGGAGAPIASLRLKAFRRGQQDVDLLEALRRKHQVSRRELERRVRAFVDLRSSWSGRDAEDAGALAYPHVTPRDLLALRCALWRALLLPR
jgi:hypothetical protein